MGEATATAPAAADEDEPPAAATLASAAEMSADEAPELLELLTFVNTAGLNVHLQHHACITV